jgi:hypothetical protein
MEGADLQGTVFTTTSGMVVLEEERGEKGNSSQQRKPEKRESGARTERPAAERARRLERRVIIEQYMW